MSPGHFGPTGAFVRRGLAGVAYSQAFRLQTASPTSTHGPVYCRIELSPRQSVAPRDFGSPAPAPSADHGLQVQPKVLSAVLASVRG